MRRKIYKLFTIRIKRHARGGVRAVRENRRARLSQKATRRAQKWVLSYPSRIGTQEVKRSAAREWVSHIHWEVKRERCALTIPSGGLVRLCSKAGSSLSWVLSLDYIYIIPQKRYFVNRFCKSFLKIFLR